MKIYSNIGIKLFSLKLFFYSGFLFLFLLNPDCAGAGAYLNSAHGSSAYGAKRSASGFPADYPKGLCAHCHEQHASVDNSEPGPSGGSPSAYELFYDNHISQTDGICYECHKDSGSFQTGGSIINRSYSYRAGGWTSDLVNDILEAFSFSSPDSSHNLDDIRTFITGKWGYTGNSNPCAACHNPHSLQGDPPNAANSVKNDATRGWVVSRPSLHSTDNNAWGLWGDIAGERMSVYNYQAPYRYSTTTNYEPDGSTTTQDGSNLTDFATFCSDCHNNTNTINSTALARNLNKFSWSTEQHGGGAASAGCPDILNPYQVAQCGTYVLSCTDCHESHGSPNLMLIRKEVNGAEVTVDVETGFGPFGRENTEWMSLCVRCHDGLDTTDGNHTHPFFIPPQVSGCSSFQCHEAGDIYRVCTECHSHGNQDIDGTPFGEPLL
ncbi:MAG: hypothetical protein HY807_06195 [Nitrospirae bacterium]|nr:hypothetical protein [Nitrospirota bacterium]